MKTALILGGTGLIGKSVTRKLLADIRYSKVIILVRKHQHIIHEKLVQVAFDYDNPDTAVLVADEVYCCLGTTIRTAGNKAAFYKVDHDYVANTAAIAHSNGVKKFAFVSSMGANKNSSIFYNRTKGETEEALIKIGFESLYIFRPSLLLGKRAEFRAGEMIGKKLMTALSFLIPKKYKPIQASQVAHGMIMMMNSGKTGLHILESDSITDILKVTKP